MAASIPCRVPAQHEDVAELRCLLELSAVRRLAERGLCGQELGLVKKLADATMRAARSRDAQGYLQADMTFHLCLLELTGDPALSDIARLLLAPDPRRAPRIDLTIRLMTREAQDHRELTSMLADGKVSSADRLLRTHLTRPPDSRQALARFPGPEPVRRAGGA